MNIKTIAKTENINAINKQRFQKQYSQIIKKYDGSNDTCASHVKTYKKGQSNMNNNNIFKQFSLSTMTSKACNDNNGTRIKNNLVYIYKPCWLS